MPTHLTRTLFRAVPFLALILSHFLYLREVPGFHFDEGWAGEFSHRIANEAGFWPAYALSTYTAASSHYFTALFFKIFGTSALTFRACGMLEVIAGVGLISWALRIAGEKRAAWILPGLVAFFPALIMNQRWSVELSNFAVLCTGLVATGMSLRWKRGPSLSAYLLIMIGCVLGVSCHVVLIAPVFTLWYCLFVSGRITDQRDRLVVAATALLLLPFFGMIYRVEAEHEKALGLLALVPGVIGITFLPTRWLERERVKGIQKVLLWGPALIGSLLLVPFLLFIEGTWLALFSTGELQVKALAGVFLIPIFLIAFLVFRSGWRPKTTHATVYAFLPISLLIVYAMVIKAGPRYLEVQFLYAAVALALAISRLKFHQSALAGAIWVILGSSQLWLNYYKPSIDEKQVDVTFHLWRWRDGSGGFLPKFRLIRRMVAEGCSPNDLDFEYSMSELRFLGISDWPTPERTNCNFGKRVRIESRKDEKENTAPGKFVEGPFVILSPG